MKTGVAHKSTNQSASNKSMKGMATVAVGSGSRPTPSKIKTESSAPKNAKMFRG